jgi:hypothetical protein
MSNTSDKIIELTMDESLITVTPKNVAVNTVEMLEVKNELAMILKRVLDKVHAKMNSDINNLSEAQKMGIIDYELLIKHLRQEKTIYQCHAEFIKINKKMRGVKIAGELAADVFKTYPFSLA